MADDKEVQIVNVGADYKEEEPVHITLTASEFDKIQEILGTLSDSCEEGLNDEWDCASNEGKQGFVAMMELINEVADKLGMII